MSGSGSRAAWVWVAGGALVLSGVFALAFGSLAWFFSNCCGSAEPAQAGYLIAGVLGAVAMWCAAGWLFRWGTLRSGPRPAR